MDKPGDRYSPVLDAPEPQLQDDELAQLAVDRAVFDKLRVLWRERETLIKAVLIAFIAFLVLAYIIPKRYESTMRLMPPETQQGNFGAMLNLLAGGGGGTGSSALGGLASSLLGARTNASLLLGIMTSREVSDRIITRFDLATEYGVAGSQAPMEYSRRELMKNIAVQEDRKSGIITITLTSRSPEEAQAMAFGYADELTRVFNMVSASPARRERLFLEKRLAAIKVELDDSAKKFAAYASKTTAFNIPEQAKAVMTAAARIQGELAAAESELEGMRQIYTDNNIRVKALRERIAELRRQADATDKNTSPDSLGGYIHNLPKLGIEWADLYRRAMINEAVYEAMTKQYEFAKVQEAKELAPVTLLDPPDFPEKKASPKRSYLILGGMFFTFLFASAWVLAKDAWQNLDPADQRKQFAEEVWQSLPRFNTSRLTFSRRG